MYLKKSFTNRILDANINYTFSKCDKCRIFLKRYVRLFFFELLEIFFI